MENEVLNISLDELAKIEGLSIRSQNVCEGNGLNDIVSILNYYRDNNHFLRIRNCGVKSNLELISICVKYNKIIIVEEISIKEEKQVNTIANTIDSLTITQKSILNNLIYNLFNGLTFRSQNALQSFLNNDITLKSLAKNIYLNTDFQISSIRNIGVKSEKELLSFFELIREQIEFVSGIEDEHKILIELFISFIRRNFTLNNTIIDIIKYDYNYSIGLPVFRLLKLLIDNNIIFDKRDKEIFNNEFCTNQNDCKKADSELANKLNISRERVRQIKKSLLRRFDYIFSFVSQPEFKSLVNYDFAEEDYILEINEDIIDQIRKTEEVIFNGLFISNIFALIFKNKYDLLGKYLLSNSNKDIYEYNNKFYLLDKQISSIASIDLLINDIQKRISKKIEEDYKLHFQTYLLNYVSTKSFTTLNIIAEIAEYILFNEFELILDSDENIVFKKNTKKQVIEYVYEVLEEKNEPLTVYEIFRIIEQKNPGTTKSPESIRGSCQRDANLIFFGRSSTYGLKKWEKELDVKGGTIRDIAEEFLQEQTEPKHIDEITAYVNKYRDTNSKNIYSNLKMDESKRFVFYIGTYIGLISKVYLSNEFIETKTINKSVKTWEESFILLNEFSSNNNRLPISFGSETETKLYRFLNIQLKKDRKGELDSVKSELLNKLVKKYPYKARKGRYLNKLATDNREDLTNNFDISEKSNKNTPIVRAKSITLKWWNSFNDLSSYTNKTNGQYPSATQNRELYIFCYQCYKNLKNGSLQPKQIEALKSIDFNFSPNTQNTWEDYFKNLKDFYNDNQHWPKYNKINAKESKLYRFCNSIFRSLENGELSFTQQKMLEGIGFPFIQGYLSNVWMDNYEKLRVFRQKYPNRWPRARSDRSEKQLYQFCYRNKNKFLEASLEEFKIKLLNEINFDFYE